MLYACYLYNSFLFVCLFVCLFFGRFFVKKVFFRIYNCVCKFDENKIKIKKKKKEFLSPQFVHPGAPQLISYLFLTRDIQN